MRVIKVLLVLVLLSGFAGGAFLWLRDEPPSAEVQQWLQQARNKPAQSAAYMFLAGLDAPLRHSPAALGAARLRGGAPVEVPLHGTQEVDQSRRSSEDGEDALDVAGGGLSAHADAGYAAFQEQ